VTATGASALYVAGGGGLIPGRSSNELGHPSRRLTDLLLALNCSVFVANLAMGGDKLLVMGAKVNSAILAGQWWRLLTATTLHGGVLHLLVNCVSLSNIGPLLERISGQERFAAVYALSGLTGSLASFCFNSHPSVGASGAIFGLGGALAVFFYRHRELMGDYSERVLNQLGMNLLINFGFGLLSRSIDNWAHFGGMLGGAIVAWLLGPRLVLRRSEEGDARRKGKPDVRFEDHPPIPIFASSPRVLKP